VISTAAAWLAGCPEAVTRLPRVWLVVVQRPAGGPDLPADTLAILGRGERAASVSPRTQWCPSLSSGSRLDQYDGRISRQGLVQSYVRESRLAPMRVVTECASAETSSHLVKQRGIHLFTCSSCCELSDLDELSWRLILEGYRVTRALSSL
jgi:hypothetical protein